MTKIRGVTGGGIAGNKVSHVAAPKKEPVNHPVSLDAVSRIGSHVAVGTPAASLYNRITASTPVGPTPNTQNLGPGGCGRVVDRRRITGPIVRWAEVATCSSNLKEATMADRMSTEEYALSRLTSSLGRGEQSEMQRRMRQVADDKLVADLVSDFRRYSPTLPSPPAGESVVIPQGAGRVADAPVNRSGWAVPAPLNRRHCASMTKEEIAARDEEWRRDFEARKQAEANKQGK
jgi:hypothetical protein